MGNFQATILFQNKTLTQSQAIKTQITNALAGIPGAELIASRFSEDV